ncbi:DUF4145 domain-containing protein [Marinobacter sp. GN3S48]|uniref:DUF4145 domain-containing protein n=1 Tax=Marinobacter sp. GN3S48 TaxID=3382302 RepID=UPI00387B1E7F
MNEQQYLTYLSHRFRRTFHDSYTPEWSCPHCDRGLLTLDRESFYYIETSESSERRREPDWEPEMTEYSFSARFHCNRCYEQTFTVGTGREAAYYDSSAECGDVIYIDEFMPKFFFPTLKLFNVPKSCPDSIRKVVESCFAVAWADIPAGGNRLRVAIEKLVDDLQPPKRESESLHSKINRLSSSYPQESRILYAIKWLGNEASHDDNLEEHDLAFGFRSLDLVLRELYSKEKDEVAQLAEEIIKNKGPIRFG